MKKWIIALVFLMSFQSSFAGLHILEVFVKDDSTFVPKILNVQDSVLINGEKFNLQDNIPCGEGKLYYIEVPNQNENGLFYIDQTSSKEIPMWLSVLPPLIAIIIALIFKEVLIAMFIGLFGGAFIYNGLSISRFFNSLMNVVDNYILHAVSNSDHMSIVIFSLLIGGMVAIISKNGGMMGIVNLFSKFANSAKNAQIVTWILGLAIFFDDYANTLIVGNAMRPITDKFKISREKLAYIVDSTAAPIAAIAFITTWIGAELGYIDGFIKSEGLPTSPYALFVNSLQYAYYPIMAIIFMFILIYMKKDFGPMFKAEIRARKTGVLTLDESNKEHSEDLSKLDAKEGIKYKWYNAGIPILTVLLVTLAGLIITGYEPSEWKDSNSFFSNISYTIGNSNSYVALLWASLSGLLMAILITIIQKIMELQETMETMMTGIQTMFGAILILVFAWALAGITKDLHTADFLSNLLSGSISPMLLPAIIFVLAGFISFSTGSSWGTMAILYPIALPLSWELGNVQGLGYEENIALLIPNIAMVLSGSVLGDHCSPISDTTILSSLATKCNHIDHVRTQLPYALVVGLIALLLQFSGLLGVPFIVNIIIGVGMCFGIIKFFGKSIEE